MTEMILEEYTENLSCPNCGAIFSITLKSLSASEFLEAFKKGDKNRIFESVTKYVICKCGKTILSVSPIRLMKILEFAKALDSTYDISQLKPQKKEG